MAATLTWPRQPQAGQVANYARYRVIDGEYWVELQKTSTTYSPAVRVTTPSRAQEIAKRLNAIFAIPGADLDFITPGWENGSYVVLWSGTVAAQDMSLITRFGENGEYTAYENLYCGCVSNSHSYAYRSRSNVKVIATVTAADETLLGMEPWKIALMWANSIRKPVTGWDCAKDCTDESHYLYSPGLTITQLKNPGSKCYSGKKNVLATFYGDGELQPNLTTKNEDIFHCCDLTVARPKNMTDAEMPMNSWIRITYGSKSVVARVTDICGTNALDLTSGGVAYALNCYGSETVTISAP